MKKNQISRLKRHGFSLIVTISIMALLAIILLGLLSLSTTVQRESTINRHMVEAQANARMALMLAIADLQKYTGPDQRVTANAEILGATENKYWTGVWTTTQPTDPTKPVDETNPPNPAKPVITGGGDPAHSNKAYLSDFRNTPSIDRQGLQLAWLVSGNPNPKSLPSYSATSTPVTLVEKSSGLSNATASDPNGKRVTAPLVEINQGTANAGAYAYWASDESVKARIDLKSTDKQPNVTNPSDGGLARLSGSESPNISKVKAGTQEPYIPVQNATAEEHQKMITKGTLALFLPGNPLYKENFHDFTVNSESVLADVRDGGLKKDLTSYISKSGTSGIPTIPNIAETGLAELTGITGRSMLPGSLYGSYAPNFLQLRNWYALRKNVSGNVGAGTMSPVFLPTRVSTRAYGPMPDIKKSAQAVQPYITSVAMSYDFSVDTARANNQAVRLHLYPRVTLWNPYNVKIRPTKYWVGYYKMVQGMASGPTQPENIPGTNGSYYGNHTNNSNMIYFLLDVGEMAPGECIILSPRSSSESTKYDISNPANNVLTAATPSGGLENFYFDCNKQIQSTITDWQTRNYQLHIGEHRIYTLKSYAANPDTAPIIQRLATNSRGEAGSNYAGSPHGNWKGSENGAPPKTSANHNNTVPSRHWYSQARMQWLDECRVEMTGGYAGNPVGQHAIRKPIIANFNVRPSVVHRDNFDVAFEQWYWNYGAYLDSRGEQKPINDNAYRGAYASGKSYGSPFGYPADYAGVRAYTMFDVPQRDTPLFSLASFQHAQLSYQGWHPTYIVGNSMCEPRCGSGTDNRNPAIPYLSRDITVNEAYYLGYGGGASNYKNAWDAQLEIDRPYNPGSWEDLIQGSPNAASGNMQEMLFYDASFMVNYALWDRFFLSTLPHNDAGNSTWDGNDSTLPFSKMTLNPYSNLDATQRQALAAGPNSFDYMSYLLMNEGAFNINSTSVEAWRAFFSTLNDVERPTADGKKLKAAFSRLLIPTTDGATGNHLAAGSWSGARKLTDAEIDRLAIEIVRVVKARGPFLGVADFVNRRLVKVKGEIDGSADLNEDKEGHIKTDASLCGPLQAAIEAAGINQSLQQDTITSPSLSGMAVPGGDWATRDARRGGWSFDNRALNPDFWAFSPWKTFGMPGYLTQADVLQTIGGNITARGDTFIIRTYGDKRDASGKILARAWCEAVVQRTPDYISTKPIDKVSDADGNNPLEPLAVRSTTDYSSTENPKITPLNKKFGRKYVIKSFRWLAPSEV